MTIRDSFRLTFCSIEHLTDIRRIPHHESFMRNRKSDSMINQSTYMSTSLEDVKYKSSDHDGHEMEKV